MATAMEHHSERGPSFEKDHSGIRGFEYSDSNGALPKQRTPYGYGGNHLGRAASNDPDLRLAAFGGDYPPAPVREPARKFANPAPLGLSAFALTTFVLSLINVKTRHIGAPNLVVALAYGYGGLVQLLAGMWEMAVGNTFGATALSSYGGFWLSFAIILTPGGFEIEAALIKHGTAPFYNSFGLYLMGWFIFTTILLFCTLRSTIAFFSLFLTLDAAFLLLAIGYLNHSAAGPSENWIIGGGACGLAAAFLAWYNALAGIADTSNSFFPIPVGHFPWSDKGREMRNKVDNSAARGHTV